MAIGPIQSRGGWLVLFGIGIGAVAWHASTSIGGSLRSKFFGDIFPLILSVVLLAALVWLWTQELSGQQVLRLAGWCLLGAIIIGGAAVTVILATPTDLAISPLETGVDAGTAGALVGLLVGVYDLHQRLSRREALARERETRHMNERLTVLNRVLRHDVRNDVNAILGYAELARDEDGDVETALDVIEERARQIQKLSRRGRDIEALLDSEGEETVPVDLAGVVRETLAELEPAVVGVDIHTEVPDSATVLANPMIDVAVENCIENAIEHTAEPTVHLTVRLERVGPEWKLTIADNGPGIPPSEIQILERGEESQLRHSSGLGLWLVHWIVRESGGSVSFEENDPSGSVVRIALSAGPTENT